MTFGGSCCFNVGTDKCACNDYTWPNTTAHLQARIADLEAENDVLARCVLDLLGGDIDTSRIRPDSTRGNT